MKVYLAVMIGGALGSAARYGVASWIDARTGVLFPWGTFAVNVIGSFIIGLFLALTMPGGSLWIGETARMFVAIGFLGGFTTFSSFSFQTITLLQDGQWVWATGNAIGSVVACLVATMAGVAAATVLAQRL